MGHGPVFQSFQARAIVAPGWVARLAVGTQPPNRRAKRIARERAYHLRRAELGLNRRRRVPSGMTASPVAARLIAELLKKMESSAQNRTRKSTRNKDTCPTGLAVSLVPGVLIQERSCTKKRTDPAPAVVRELVCACGTGSRPFLSALPRPVRLVDVWRNYRFTALPVTAARFRSVPIRRMPWRTRLRFMLLAGSARSPTRRSR
jgi:hypothetical protein